MGLSGPGPYLGKCSRSRDRRSTTGDGSDALSLPLYQTEEGGSINIKARGRYGAVPSSG
jgi:hypothetical protein